MQMVDLLFTVEIHSGGSFERNSELVYLGGRVVIVSNCDPNRLSYFEIQNMCVEYGASSTSSLYYLIPRGN